MCCALIPTRPSCELAAFSYHSIPNYSIPASVQGQKCCCGISRIPQPHKTGAVLAIAAQRGPFSQIVVSYCLYLLAFCLHGLDWIIIVTTIRATSSEALTFFHLTLHSVKVYPRLLQGKDRGKNEIFLCRIPSLLTSLLVWLNC